MSEKQQKNERVSVNLEIFDLVKRLYTTKTKQELLEITNLSLSACNFKFRRLTKEPSFQKFLLRQSTKLILI